MSNLANRVRRLEALRRDQDTSPMCFVLYPPDGQGTRRMSEAELRENLGQIEQAKREGRYIFIADFAGRNQ